MIGSREIKINQPVAPFSVIHSLSAEINVLANSSRTTQYTLSQNQLYLRVIKTFCWIGDEGVSESDGTEGTSDLGFWRMSRSLPGVGLHIQRAPLPGQALKCSV